eukprot:2121105-Alexandrium_andersonii.AAC.1
MSASLVGSEMCIRDRWSTVNSAAKGLRRSAPDPSTARAPKAHAERDAASVSYTHLTLPTICSV